MRYMLAVRDMFATWDPNTLALGDAAAPVREDRRRVPPGGRRQHGQGRRFLAVVGHIPYPLVDVSKSAARVWRTARGHPYIRTQSGGIRLGIELDETVRRFSEQPSMAPKNGDHQKEPWPRHCRHPGDDAGGKSLTHPSNPQVVADTEAVPPSSR